MQTTITKNIIISLLATLVVAIFADAAQAMPMFARKYGVSCSACHTSPPKLNEVGYKFRAAGFRWANEIGQETGEGFRLSDYNSIRIQLRYDTSRTETGSAASTSHRFRLQAVEGYLMTGAWGKNFSTNIKTTYLPGEDPQLETAYVRYTDGTPKLSFTARAGIFHPYDGIEATDSPATISRPFIQTQTANFDQNTFYKTWGFDQSGAEVGFDYRKTSVRAALFNGVSLHRTNGVLKAFADQGGPLTRSSALPTNGKPDVQLFVNQMLTRKGGSVAVHYYQGTLTLPTALPTASFRNDFNRIAVYGSYPLTRRLSASTGFQRGTDRRANGTEFNSNGMFVEAMTQITKLSAVGVRYDHFDPASAKLRNEISGVTTYANLWFKSRFRVVVEHQHRQTLRGSAATQTANAFQMRLIFIK